jgi:hypothetical protein
MRISTRPKLSYRTIKNAIILFPFLLIFISEILSISNKGTSSIVKVSAVIYMIIYAIFYRRYHNNFLFLFLLFIPFFTYGIVHSFSIEAALTEAIRYLFPITILLYSFSIRDHFKLLIKVFILFVIINDLYQILNYINWIRGIDQWFYLYRPDGSRSYNASSGIIRATGIVAFFGLFGFINLIAFFLTRRFYEGKRKTLLLIFFTLFMFLSFSYKSIGSFFVLLFLEYRDKLKLFFVIVFVFLIALISIPSTLTSMGENFSYRIREYVTEGNSARAESYRVMFSDFSELNFFGRGVGSFGGPSSVSFNSPVYKDVDFNWYVTTNLATTDTYYPHLFVEMGLIGGLLYLLVIFSPLLFFRWDIKKFKIVFIIYFSLFVDSLFSYSLNNIAFLAVSLIFIYPIYYMDKNKTVSLLN